MELEEGWELIPEEGFLEIQYDGGKQIYSRKYSGGSSKCVIQRNHFNQFVETTDDTTTDHHHDQQPVPIPITLPVTQDQQDVKIKSFNTGADQDPVSQVFFKKMNETEFISDMKLESPRSNRGVMPPQVEGAFQFEGEHETGDSIKNMELGEGGDGGLNIWKGIGAICSFGMAAATICVIVLSGSHQQNKHKLQFQMYTNDKRMKKAFHHTDIINEAISAVRGVAAARPARITVGAQYSGSQ